MSPFHPSHPVRAFLAGLATASARILVLDYDGTLAPFVGDRRRAVPYEGVPERLARVMEAETRVVVVSGRPLAELAPLLPVDPLPELWGSHGWERRPPGGPVLREPLDREESALLAEAAAAAASLLPSERIESKPGSVAVHVRGLSPAGARRTLERIGAAWRTVEASQRMRVEPFDGGLEARVRRRDKGSAVRAILAGEPSDAHVAYLGDDRTDEDAFRALRGKALRLLVRAEPRPTEADARLVPPAELLEFLDAWIRVTAGPGAVSRGTPLAPPEESEGKQRERPEAR